MAWEDHEELKAHAYRSERYKRTYWSEYTHAELVEEFKRSKDKAEWFKFYPAKDYNSDEEMLAEFIKMDKNRRRVRNAEALVNIDREIAALDRRKQWYLQHADD